MMLMVLGAGVSRAQIGSGTIVILDATKDKLVIAADSRLTLEDGSQNDSQCKIEVFRHRIAFVQVGSVGYERGPVDPFPSWRNSALADRAAREMGNSAKDPDVEIKDIASIWANSLAAYWNQAYLSSRDAVERTAKPGGGLITGAVFAEARSGAVHWRFVGVGLNPTLNPPQVQAFTGELHDCWPCGEGERVCALAHPEIPKEFCTQSSPRAREEAAHWKPSLELVRGESRETLHAIRLVDDTIAFDPIGGLGGKVDVLELHNDGSINWVQRKSNCPDNED